MAVAARQYDYINRLTMKALALLFAAVFQLVSGPGVVVPGYPPLAVSGGNVVAVIKTSDTDGHIQVDILYGDKPFVEPTREALAQWRLPGSWGAKPAVVVVNFRDATLSMMNSSKGIRFEGTQRKLTYNGGDRSVALPELITDPVYSDASLVVLGASILHLQVGETGSVGRVEVIKDLGDYTSATVEAVKKWKFSPALDANGAPVVSDVFAVCVYRPLIVTREPQ